MRILFFLFFIFSLPAACQDSMTETPKSDDWEVFLNKFPTRTLESLMESPTSENLGDSISPFLLNKMLWKNKNKPNIIYKKNNDFQYPVGTKIYTDSIYNVRGRNKNSKNCQFPLIVYPYFKIKLGAEKTLLSYLEFEIGEGMIFQTLFVLDGEMKAVGYFAFIYSHSWKLCDNDLNEILTNSKRWSAPSKILVNQKGFVLHDQMVGSYYEDTLQDQYWTVFIRDDGKFEIVDEKKNYEDGTVTLWSKKGYAISDADGYVNMRAAENTSSEIITRLDNDTQLEILDASSDWWKVSADGSEGFIHRSRIQKL